MNLAICGFQVIVGKKRFIYDLLDMYSDYIYLDKGYHEDVSEFIYEKINANNGVVVNLDEEGAVDFPNNSTLLNRYSPKMLNVVDKVFLWGNNQKEIIEDAYGKCDKLLVTGHPRFLLLKNGFLGYYDKAANQLKNRFGDFVLVNTNLGFGNNVKGDAFVEANYGLRFDKIGEIIREDKLKLKAIIELVDYLSKQQKVIIRPHPEERLETYQDFYENNVNVEVVREDSSIPWILACAACIHIDCTTGIESSILDKRVISYVPEYLNLEYLTKLPLEVSEVISSVEDIQQLLNSDKTFQTGKNVVLRDYFSIERNIDDFINDIALIRSTVAKFSFKKNDKWFLGYLNPLRSVLRRVRAVFNVDPLERSKLSNLNYQSVKLRYDFYRYKDPKLANCVLKVKSDVYMFDVS